MAEKQIKFVFEGDTADLEKALASVGRQFDKTEKKAKGLGITGADAAKFAKAGMLAAVVAAALLAAAFAKTAMAALDLAAKADKIAKSAAAVGASAEEWQKVIGAFELGGLTAEQTEMAIKKLGLRIGQVAAGAGGPAADAFTKLGLTWQELEALPLPERMATIADRVKDLGSATQRAAVLNAIFEESGIQMAGAFAKGGDAIRDAAQQIEDAGIISNKVAEQAEAMTDAVTIAKQAFESLKVDALAPIIPMITEVTNVFIDMMNEFRETGELEQFGEAFADVFLEVILPAAILAVGSIQKSIAALEASYNAARVLFNLGEIGGAGNLKIAAAALAGLRGEREKAIEILGIGSTALADYQQSLRDLGGTQADVDKRTESLNAKFAEIQRRLAKQRGEAKRTRKAFGDLAEGIGEVDDALEEMGSRVLEITDELTLGKGFASVEDDIEAHAEFLKEQAGEIADAFSPIAEAFDDIAGSLGGLFSQAASNIADTISESEAELANLDDRIAEATTDRERAMLEDRKRLIEEEIREQKKAALAMFVAQKVTAISQAAVAAALAVITGFAQGGPPLAVAAAIAGGIAIATIAAEPPPSFHAGGMVSMGAPDEITARLLRSEAVLSPQGVAAAGGEDGVRDLNRGAGGQPPVVSVLQGRSRVVDAMISDNLRQKQGPLTDALRAARPRALGRHNPFASS